ncbi:MAG: hypothetical protein WCJ35_27300 [Planctomycetota bacterium]
MAKDKPKEDPLPAVLAAIADLKRGHEEGLALLKQYGDRAGRGEIDQAAVVFGRTTAVLRKLRQFATEYSKKDLQELCDMCREHSRAFGLSLVGRLVAVKDKKPRAEFQREAIINRWSGGRIFRELQRRKITLRHHSCGRKRALPQTIAEALTAIEEARRLFVELVDHCTKLAEKSRGKSKERLLILCKKLLSEIRAAE